MRSIIFKLLYWLAIAALVAVGIYQPHTTQDVQLERHVKEYLPWLSANAIAFAAFLSAGFLIGIQIWDETYGRWLRNRHNQEERRLNGENLREISGEKAIDYLAHETVWGWRAYSAQNFFELVRWDAFDELERGAKDGDVRVRGRQEPGGDYLPINKGFWIDAKIDRLDDRRGMTVRASSMTVFRPLMPYTHCVVSVLDLQETWPRASFVRRGLTSAYVLLKRGWFRIISWPERVVRFGRPRLIRFRKVLKIVCRKNLRRHVPRQIPLA